MAFFLPGSAAEDMMVTAGKAAETIDPESLKQKIDMIREQTVKALEILPPNPLRLMDDDAVPGRNNREGTVKTDDNRDK